MQPFSDADRDGDKTMSNDQAKGHDSRGIANIFVEKAKTTPGAAGPLTIMSLLKYVYLAHGWTLGYTDKPLICHTVEAWKYGPVVPEVYRAFSKQGMYITQMERFSINPFHSDKPALSDMQQKIINAVYKEYSSKSAVHLSELTHRVGTPWHQFRHIHYGKIPNDAIHKYYKNLVETQQQWVPQILL